MKVRLEKRPERLGRSTTDGLGCALSCRARLMACIGVLSSSCLDAISAFSVPINPFYIAQRRLFQFQPIGRVTGLSP